MKKRIVTLSLCACALAASMALAGCSSKAEEPVAPATQGTATQSEPAAAGSAELTPADKLADMAVGETAVWNEYEATVTSIDRADGKLTVHVDVAGRGRARTIEMPCLLSFGMPSVESSFGTTISVPAEGKASGTFTFDDPYHSTRLLWNDGAIEATWMLDEQAPAPSTPTDEPKDEAADQQKADAATIESKIPELIANDTYYAFQSLDPATASVSPQEGGGYTYENDIAILDGNGYPITAHLSSTWDAGLMCTSLTIDGMIIF